MDIMLYLLTILVAGHAGFALGWKFRDIHQAFYEFFLEEEEPESMTITPNAPDEVLLSDSSQIVTPKSPDQIERERELELRKRNGL